MTRRIFDSGSIVVLADACVNYLKLTMRLKQRIDKKTLQTLKLTMVVTASHLTLTLNRQCDSTDLELLRLALRST